MLQRAQIKRSRFAAANQQDMAQTQPLAAAGAVHPAQDHPLKDNGGRGQQIEQRQHDAGIIVKVHQVKRGDKDHDACRVDNGNFGAALCQTVQAGVGVDARDPVDEHQHERGAQPGKDVAGVARYGQCGAGAARLKEPDKVEADIVGKQKADKKQRCIEQQI